MAAGSSVALAMGMRRPEIAELLAKAYSRDRIRDVNAGDGWPSTCEVWDGNRWRPASLYLGVIAPSSGRGRPGELRMQNPADAEPIASQRDGVALLLGVWQPEDAGKSVLVAWDAVRRTGRDTRFSLFVPGETVQCAQNEGRAFYASPTHERVLAFAMTEQEALHEILVEADASTMSASRVQEESEMSEADDDAVEQQSELEGLAEKLAALSSGETPKDFATPPSTFDATDVDWSSNAWLARVVDIQDWLALEATLDATSGAQATCEALFTLLEDPSPSHCFDISDGLARLTDPGIARLGARLDTAIQLKDAFTEELDEGKSVAEASRSWTEAWEESSITSTDVARTTVHASVDTWQIYKFRDQASADALELNPSYQRGNVWTDKESSELIDSVLRGIPLPSIILNQRKGDETLEIVDGKQRLTAILRFIGRHPDARRFVEVVEAEDGIPARDFENNYPKWRSAVRKKRGLSSEDEKRHFLPFPYRLTKGAGKDGGLEAQNGKYYCQMKDAEVQIEGRQEPVKRIFELPMTKYKLSVILYEDTDIHQIHKVFGLYNRQGKKLNATEVRNAIYHHLHIARLVLLLSGDSNDAKSLAPYLVAQNLHLQTIPEMLKAMNVGEGRFNRTKLTSWVAALLVHRLESKASLPCPGSTSLVEGMMVSIADGKGHTMHSERACEQLAHHLHEGAALLTNLRNMEAFWPKFTHPTSPGEKWEDLPAVAAWTACTIAAMAGVSATPETRAVVLEVTRKAERLKKQQARSQWGYISRVTLDLLQALQMDLVAIGNTLEKRLGNNCIAALEARRD